MKAYSIDYKLDGRLYLYKSVEAKDKESARNKIGRRHKLNAEEASKRIKLVRVSVVGYF